MAAIRCALWGSKEISGNSLISAIGGNCLQFGIQVGGLPEKWFVVNAEPPVGRVHEPHSRESCLGAFGDSALLEGFGYGNLALSYCPSMHQLHEIHPA